MKRSKSFLVLTLLAALATGSCYHEFPGGTGGGGGGGGTGGGGNNGNTFLNVTITTTPSSTFSFASLNWPIGQINIVNSAGQLIQLGAPPAIPDFVRLSTDSLYVGHTTVKATSYGTLQVQLDSPVFSYFYNSSNATLLGCAPATVCAIPGTTAGFGATTVSVPISLTTTANANQGIRVNFDLSKAVTTAAGMTFDFTQAGAITVSNLPAVSSQSSGLDTLDNFTGTVTAVSGSSFTVGSFSSEQRTFTVAANAEFDDPFAVCTGQAGFSCLATNQNVSLDAVVNTDGTFTAYEVEFLDRAPLVQELEGVIITPISNNQFRMVLTNGMGASPFIVGTLITVNLSNTATFAVDPKNLGVTTSPLGFQSQSDLVLGQTVMVQGGTVNGANGNISNETRILLRYSTIPGTVQSPSNPIFTLSSVSPLFNNLTNNTVQVQTFGGTAYDKITSFSGLVASAGATVRGLYLNPNSGSTQPVLAAKVRVH